MEKITDGWIGGPPNRIHRLISHQGDHFQSIFVISIFVRTGTKVQIFKRFNRGRDVRHYHYDVISRRAHISFFLNPFASIVLGGPSLSIQRLVSFSPASVVVDGQTCPLSIYRHTESKAKTDTNGDTRRCIIFCCYQPIYLSRRDPRASGPSQYP